MHRRLVVPAVAVIVVIAALVSIDSGSSSSSTVGRQLEVGPAPPAVRVCEVPAPTVPAVTLDPGLLASGDPIKAVQTALGITTDGVYGPVTAAAVGAVQAPQDGCTIAAAQTVLLAALQALTDAQGDLTAQAVARRAAPPRVSSSTSSPSRSGNVAAFLECTKEIESHGNYEDVDSTLTYWGAYQFDQSTWDGAVTRAGFPQWAGQPPNGAPPAVQDAAAIQLYSERGNQPWGGRC